MYDKTAIGKRIKELREKAGMSQDSMALCNRPYRVRYGRQYNRDFLYSLINITERLCK